MSAGLQEHPGNEAGRVTLVTTLTSLLPMVVVCAVIVVSFVLEIISAEIAGAALMTALGQGTLTSGTVFGTAKKTKTDRADVVWGSPPVVDLVHPLESDAEDVKVDNTQLPPQGPEEPLRFSDEPVVG